MEYPCVITLLDGKSETILSIKDFEYLIDKYMGFESLKYFRSICSTKEEDDTYEQQQS